MAARRVLSVRRRDLLVLALGLFSPACGSEPEAGRPAADPPRVQGLLQQGHEAVVRGNADEARRLYQLVLDEQPDHPVAHHRLGILADRGGQYATAERHYLRALRGRPTDADLLSDLGYFYFLQGRPIESEKFLREALQADPGHRHARDNLSVLFDRSKAESVLRTVQSPREASQTLASLFDDGPNSGQMDLNTDTPPEGVDPNDLYFPCANVWGGEARPKNVVSVVPVVVVSVVTLSNYTHTNTWAYA